MKLQSLTIIFIIIILPVSLVLSAYIGYELKTIEKQNLYNSGLISATHYAIFSFEINSKNDEFSNNPEMKRDIVKSAVKTFENSLSTTCNLGLYGNSAIEEYIPAIVFGLYDGFYMYAPYQTNDGYKHDLRNYVYYSETVGDDIVIRYSLDNYVTVSGTINGTYQTKAGYLINTAVWQDDIVQNTETLKPYSKYNSNNKSVNKIEDENELKDSSAKKYLEEAKEFTEWFNGNVGYKANYLEISSTNDPENEAHAFTQHKRQIMKDKIQSILNSSITAYSAKSKNNYKMPVLTEEDWGKIYTNISATTFVQGMNLGFKKYNNYCVLNSTNSNEYVNPNLIYFSDGTEYHDIRCSEIQNKEDIVGYKIGDFEKTKVEVYVKDDRGYIECTLTESDIDHTVYEDPNGIINWNGYEYKKDSYGNVYKNNVIVDDVSIERKTTETYYYKHDETACYGCINGNEKLQSNTSAYNYVKNLEDSSPVKKAYFTALARERYNTTKLSDRLNIN